jgi:adenylate kinase family enzyme
MRKVAVFGNAGGGKSTLARRLAAITGLPLMVVDMMRFRPGGAVVPHEEYVRAHARLMSSDRWIIDGFENMTLAWERFAAADTLVHVDLPLPTHFLGVTKRLLTGLFVAPHGWPEGSPVLSSSINSYRVLWPCHRKLTPKYRAYVVEVADQKRVYHLRSRREIKQFLESIEREIGPGATP